MKKRLKKVVLVIKIILLLGLSILGYYGISSALIAHGYQLDIDGHFSQVLRNDLSMFLESKIEKGVALKKMREQMLKDFPVLSRVNIRMMPHQVLWIRIEVENPLMVINDHFVMAEHKKIIKRHNYQEESIKDLPQIKAASFDPTNPDQWLLYYYDFLKALPLEIIDRFSIILRDQDQIECLDTVDTLWRIIATNKTRFSKKMLDGCAQIKKEHEKGTGNKYIDVRFKDMMVFGKN